MELKTNSYYLKFNEEEKQAIKIVHDIIFSLYDRKVYVRNRNMIGFRDEEDFFLDTEDLLNIGQSLYVLLDNETEILE